MVLLKNEDDLLPLKPGQSVALIGDFAQTPRYQGAGSSSVNATRVDNLKAAAEADDITLAGFCAGYERSGTPTRPLWKRPPHWPARPTWWCSAWVWTSPARAKA